MRFISFILLLLFCYCAIGQISEPVLLGSANWKITNAHASPEIMPSIPQKRKMIKTIYQDTVSSLVSIKIDPGVEILSNKPFTPRTGFFTSSGKKLIPSQTENAQPLLTRDNQEFNISYSDRRHGFIGNNSLGITEDNEHNIWMASESGLIKYDGYHYNLYNQKSGLNISGITAVAFDQQKKLWVATDRGLFYVKHDSLFTPQSKELDFTELRCHNIRIDHLKRVWICTKENGAICISDTTIKIYDTKCGLPSNFIFSALVDKKDNIYFGMGGAGLMMLQKDRVLRMFYHSTNAKYPNIFSTFEDENGIWLGGFTGGLINLGTKDTTQYSFFGTYKERIYDIIKAPGGLWLSLYGKGLYYYSKTKQLFINENNGLQSRHPFFLFEDSFQNIWISDYGTGFSRLNENSFFIQNFQNPILKEVGNTVKDNKNGTWIFTNGFGVQYQKGKTITQYTYVTPNGGSLFSYPQDGILAQDGTLWMGNYGEGPVKGEGDYFTQFNLSGDWWSGVCQSVKEDKNQYIWFGTSADGLIVYDKKKFWHFSKKTGLLGNIPSRLFTDAAGMIYCGFATGLQRFSDRIIETFQINDKPFTDQVNYFYCLNSAISIVGTENNGLLFLTKNKAYQLNKDNGLKSNKILSIIQSADKKIWITTDKSTEYFLMEGMAIKSHKIFSQSNGFYTANNATVLLDSLGNPYWPMFLPFPKKKILYDAVFEKNTSYSPYFSIDQVMVDNVAWRKTKSLSILPNQKLTVDYTVKYWGRENYLDIQYLLIKKNGDSSFRSVDNKGHILISDLVPGSYKIYLVARDDGKIFMSTSLQLEVHNFWYNTWLFRIIIVFLIICGMIYYYRRKGKLQLAINHLLERKVKEQTVLLRKEKEELLDSYRIIDRHNNEKDVLLQEINHRVKNNLQFMIAILDMQLRSDLPDEAKSALRSTSNRMNAMSLVHEMLYDNENFGDISIKKYLAELVGHFKSMVSDTTNSIVFHLATDDISMPMKPAISLGMIVSELVSNSFKHAFHNISNPEITIKITKTEALGQFSLYYSDNGNGISQGTAPKKGIGNRLINIFSRELDGKYTIEGTNRFVFILTFNLSNQSEKDEQY